MPDIIIRTGWCETIEGFSLPAIPDSSSQGFLPEHELPELGDGGQCDSGR